MMSVCTFFSLLGVHITLKKEKQTGGGNKISWAQAQKIIASNLSPFWGPQFLKTECKKKQFRFLLWRCRA